MPVANGAAASAEELRERRCLIPRPRFRKTSRVFIAPGRRDCDRARHRREAVAYVTAESCSGSRSRSSRTMSTRNSCWLSSIKEGKSRSESRRVQESSAILSTRVAFHRILYYQGIRRSGAAEFERPSPCRATIRMRVFPRADLRSKRSDLAGGEPVRRHCGRESDNRRLRRFSRTFRGRPALYEFLRRPRRRIVADRSGRGFAEEVAIQYFYFHASMRICEEFASRRALMAMRRCGRCVENRVRVVHDGVIDATQKYAWEQSSLDQLRRAEPGTSGTDAGLTGYAWSEISAGSTSIPRGVS